MRRLLLVCSVALAVAPVAVAAPLAVRTSFDDATVQFGDVIHARVAVVAGPGVRVGSIRVLEDLTPLTPLSEAATARTGNVLEVERSYVCVAAACVSDRGSATPKLPPVQVVAESGGRTLRVVKQWPALRVRGRVSAADVAAAQPPFRGSVVPPPPRYSLAPATLAWLLDGAAIACGIAALALVAAQLRRRAQRAHRRDIDELERAVRLVREAEARPGPDRRRAAGLLARLLAGRDAQLASAARDLAWAKPQPEPAALEELVGDVERRSS
jgi:hypothetical protein